MKPPTDDELQYLMLALRCEPVQPDGLREHGFHPAFFNLDTGTLHPSRHADGRPAEEHVLDGLPREVVVARVEGGPVIAVRSAIVAGFERGGQFFTHASAWRTLRELDCPGPDWGNGPVNPLRCLQ